MLAYLGPVTIRFTLLEFQYQCHYCHPWDWMVQDWRNYRGLTQYLSIDKEVQHTWIDVSEGQYVTSFLPEVTNPICLVDEGLGTSRVFSWNGDQWLITWGTTESSSATAHRVSSISHSYHGIPTFSQLPPSN